MAIKQTIWSLDNKKELAESSLTSENELENLISENIRLLNDDWMLIGRQVRTSYGGIIDLLCVDVGGNPILIELKKNMTPREVTAQALDYASWLNEIDADDLARIYLNYSKNKESLGEAYHKRFNAELVDNTEDIATQIVIVATDMDGSTERIIKYLQSFGIDINVLFFKVFEHNGQRLLSRAWMYEPEQNISPKRSISKHWNGEYYFNFGDDENRSWEDAVKYGFVSAGGGSWYTGTLQALVPGDRIWVNLPGKGYAGVALVAQEAQSAKDTVFDVNGIDTPFYNLPLTTDFSKNAPEDKEEWLVKVNWIKTTPKHKAISEYGLFGNQNTVCKPKTEKWEFTVDRLKSLWNIQE